MRVFGVERDGGFTEYNVVPFEAEHQEAVLEEWLQKNPDKVVDGGGVLFIGRQVSTNLGGYIDLLGIDRDGDAVVIELKRERTPRDTLAQALEYASAAVRLSMTQLEGLLRSYLSDESLSLAEHHRAYFGLGSDEAVAFNKNQRIVIVGQEITPQIRQTSEYLVEQGVGVTCIEFTFLQSDDGKRLLSQEAVVRDESGSTTPVASASLPPTTEDAFMTSLDDNGRVVFSRLLEVARQRSMPVHWGTKGFSINVNVDGTHVAVCYGYPPDSVYKQSIYTARRGMGGFAKKAAVPEEVVDSLWKQAQASGLFVLSGYDVKCTIGRQFAEADVQSVVDLLMAIADAIKTHGLRA